MTEPLLPGGYSGAELNALIRQASDELGLDHTEASLLRGHTNAVVHLGSVVLKIARKGSSFPAVERTVALVRWLQDRGFPTVPLHSGTRQPLRLRGEALATVWNYLPQPAQPLTAADLAGPLAALHRLDTPPISIRELDNIRAIRRSLTGARTLCADDRDFLSRRVDGLEQSLSRVGYVLPRSLVQGDPQHRNALHDTENRRTVLCDWDTVAMGRPEWDLVTVEIHCRRFGYGPHHYTDFADAYGIDITTWPGYPVLRDIRELRMIATNARKSHHTPGSMAEVRRRIKGIREQEVGMRWNIL